MPKHIKNWLMNVEDIANQCSVVFNIHNDCKDLISGVPVSTGNAETLAKRGGITN